MARPPLTLTACLAALAALLLAGCEGEDNRLAAIRERGELRFVTRSGPSTYYRGRHGPTGFEYELAADLAAVLDVELVLREVFTTDDLFAALRRGEADIAGAGLSLTPAHSRDHAPSVAYAQQRPQLIYRVGNGRPAGLEDLRGARIAVLRGSSEEVLLARLRRERAPWLRWAAIDSADPLALLTRVRDGDADAAALSSRSFTLQQRLMPALAVAFDLAPPGDVVWYLRPARGDLSLLLAVNRFLEKRAADGSLEALTQRHFYRDESINRVDTRTFMKAVEGRLQDIRGLIERVAREHGLPWELLAAMSYQESHWNPDATSPTGVREIGRAHV